MSRTLIDSYIRALSKLEESAFERAIVSRLSVALNNFQNIPAYPQGDGGLDGQSHNGTRAYCCYGLKYDTAKTPHQRSMQIATKFSSDLRRLYELEPKGRNRFVHKDNLALRRIFGSVPVSTERISHVTLVANWFDSHTPLGIIRQNAATYSNVSRCRWMARDADILLLGPKEFADQYSADESTMAWLMRQELLTSLEEDAALMEVPDGPTFDSKMQAVETLLPNAEEDVRKVAELLRRNWQWSIAFERRLSDRHPQLHAALERGRKQLLMRVLTHTSVAPWEPITRAQEFGESVFSDDFLALYGSSVVRDLASGEAARLVGACPINWKPKIADVDR